MRSKSFQLGKIPHLSFRACSGELRVQGWDLDDVQLLVHKESDLANAQEVNDALAIAGRMPGMVNAPTGASVLLEDCAGDVNVANLDTLRLKTHRGDLSLHQIGKIEIETVHGDVHVRECKSLHLATLHGDLRVRGVEGDLAIAVMHGDASLQATKGQSSLRDITGDVVIRYPEGQLDVRNVTGDLMLSGNLQTGDYHLEALGDIALYLEPASDAHLDLEAPLGRIACDFGLSESSKSAHQVSGNLGQGKAQVHVVAHGGDIRLRQLSADRARKEMEKERIQAEAHAHREARRASRMAERARRMGERLAREAEEMASRTRHWEVKWTTPQPKGPSPNLEAERLAILKMLSEGKINAAQAEALLGALEE